MNTHLDLFSGIGGFSIAAQRAGFKTIAFCEKEPYAQKVLIKNFGAVMADANEQRLQKCGLHDEQREKVSNSARSSRSNPALYPDIFALDGTRFRGVTLVTGGFPCQPFSCAGKRRGKEDDRSLWPEMLRVVAESRPRWVLGENVAGIINMELDAVLSDLENIGYTARPIVIPACAVDARHRRDRVWILAADTQHDRGAEQKGEHERPEVSGGSLENELESRDDLADAHQPGSQGRNCKELSERGTQRAVGTSGSFVADATQSRRRERNQDTGRSGEGTGAQEQWRGPSNPCRWLSEPAVGRVAHGIPNRSHRLRGLGNAIVPQVAEVILKGMAQLL